MSKAKNTRKLVLVGADDKRKTLANLEGECQLEIDLGGGRTLVLDLPGDDSGEVGIGAESEGGIPVINLQPGACNLVNFRIEVLPEDTVHYEDEAVEPAPGTDWKSYQFDLTVQNALPKAAAKGLPTKKELKRWAEAALEGDVEATLRFVDDEEGRQLNKEFRGKDYATNVLTFAYGDDMPRVPGQPLLGDIVLCAPVVAKEAAEQGKALAAHYAHLVVHGMLHLQGYDHEKDKEARAMEAKETRILAELGFPDPYR